jgi:uncharacterized membrane protein
MRQHGTFEDLKGYNRSFRYAVMVWILTIVFLPFPTEMIASADSRDTSANVLYIGTLLASSLASLWQSAVIDRHPEMVREDAQRKDFDPFRAGFAVALMFGALVVAAAFPSIGLWALLVMLIPNFSRRLKPSES